MAEWCEDHSRNAGKHPNYSLNLRTFTSDEVKKCANFPLAGNFCKTGERKTVRWDRRRANSIKVESVVEMKYAREILLRDRNRGDKRAAACEHFSQNAE